MTDSTFSSDPTLPDHPNTNKTPTNRLLTSLYPWIVWFLASGFIFYRYLLQVSPSVMVNELMRAFSLSGAGLGNLAAAYFYAYLLMQLPVGVMLDRFSPRKMMALAIVVCAAGALLFASAHGLFAAVSGRMLIAVGGAFSAVGTMKLISLWFPARRFALVSGLMMTMAMLGAVGGEAPLSQLVEHVGWRHAVQYSAWFGFAFAGLFGWVVRDRTQPVEASTATAEPKLNAQQFWTNFANTLRNKQSWLVSLYSGLAFAPITAFAGFWGIPFIMQKYAMSRSLTASLVSLSFIGLAGGAPFGGWLSDAIKRRKMVMITGTAVSLVILASVLYLPPMPAALLGTLMLAFGFFTGLFFVSFAHMLEINAPETSGTSLGFINMFNALFGALSQSLIGLLLDLGWMHHFQHGVRVFSERNYEHALSVLVAGLGLALILQLWIRETHCQQSK